MRLLFAGTPETALPSLEALLGSGRHDVVAVLTRPDAPAGRNRTLVRSPVARRAEEAGIAVHTPRRPGENGFVDVLEGLRLDCAPVVAYGALLPSQVLAVPRAGWVNLHFSLLPAWRGAAPVQRAILAGDDITGASTFLIEDGLDTGPLYGVSTEPIRSDDTAGALLDRLAHSGAELLLATLDGIEDGTVKPVPQSTEGVSMAAKLTGDDARIDFGRSGDRGRPADPSLHPGARSMVRVPLSPAEARPGAADVRAPRTRRYRGGTRRRPGGYRHGRRSPGFGPGTGQAADTGRGLGPRRPHRAGGATWLSGTRPGGSPSPRCVRSGSGGPTPT